MKREEIAWVVYVLVMFATLVVNVYVYCGGVW